MSATARPVKPMTRPASNPGCFKAMVNNNPMRLTSLLGSLTPRPELGCVPRHWIWKVIADGKVANRRASFGLFLDHDIAPGEYDIANDPRIRIVYNQSPHSSSNVIYHSAHFQTGSLILTEADLDRHKLAGQFSFSVSAVDFEVTEGAFDLYCSLSASR